MRLFIGSLMCVMLMSAAKAQQGPGGGQSGGGSSGLGRPGAEIADPARFKQQVLDLLREKLAANDEQWKALMPKIEKVLDAQRNIRTGAGMSFSTPMQVNGPGQGGGMLRVQGGGGTNVATPPGKAMQEIRAALEKDSSEEDFEKKLIAMREVRDKARAELVAAQNELKEACSRRQEAVLVTLGIVE